MQIFINHLKSVRVFVLILCQTLRFAKYMIFFEVFPFRRKRKKRSGEKKNENFAPETGRSRTLKVLVNHPDWATQKFKAGKSQ